MKPLRGWSKFGPFWTTFEIYGPLRLFVPNAGAYNDPLRQLLFSCENSTHISNKRSLYEGTACRNGKNRKKIKFLDNGISVRVQTQGG